MKLKIYGILLLCLCLFAVPICAIDAGNYEMVYAGKSESGFSFVPFDATGVVSGEKIDTSETDIHFGLGESYYAMSMSAGYANGMTMELETKSGSLQDTTGGASFTAEVSFDLMIDKSSQTPIQIRFFPQDKSGTVHKGNSVTKMALTPRTDNSLTLTVYDRSGKTALGEINLAEALGEYVKTDGYFFRFRYVFQATDENAQMIRSERVFVDGVEVLSTNYLSNNKEYRIAGIGIQRGCQNYGGLDNLIFAQYNGERKDSAGKEMICDDALVAAVRKAAILRKDTGEENEQTAALDEVITAAKAKYRIMQTQADCDAYAKELERAMKAYSDANLLENLVVSGFTEETALYITKNMTFPASYLPESGGIYDCSVTADKPEIVSASGAVTRPKYNEMVTLTANLVRDTDFSSLQKKFTVRVLADGNVTKLGDFETEQVHTFSPAKRVLFGGFTKEESIKVSFGENSVTVPANSEFSVVADFVAKEFVLYRNGVTEETLPLIGTPDKVVVSGSAFDCVLVSADGYGFSVKSLLFTSDTGAPRTIPVSKGFVSGAEVVCKDDTLKTTAVFAAVYENKKLVSLSQTDILRAHRYNETMSLPFHAALPEEIKNVTVKLLFAENVNEMKPIAPEYVYVAAEEINFNPVIYVAGDSTACDYSDYYFPQTGWGQVLGNYFSDEVTVSNHALGGRSSKSFIDEGRLDTILAQIQPGDYLLIQFGHNDQKTDDRRTYPDTTYRDYLKQYVDGARERGAIPIILTSVTRRIYTDGVYDNGKSLGKFPEAARAVAEDLDVPLIDAFAYSVDLVSTLGEEGSKDVFLHLVQNDERFIGDSRFTNSKYNKQEVTADNSHFQYYGAELIAGFIAQELDALHLSLSQYYVPYTPVKP